MGEAKKRGTLAERRAAARPHVDPVGRSPAGREWPKPGEPFLVCDHFGEKIGPGDVVVCSRLHVPQPIEPQEGDLNHWSRWMLACPSCHGLEDCGAEHYATWQEGWTLVNGTITKHGEVAHG
jgi:hypothetical protein